MLRWENILWHSFNRLATCYRFYGLPKLHKKREAKSPPPLRPIVTFMYYFGVQIKSFTVYFVLYVSFVEWLWEAAWFFKVKVKARTWQGYLVDCFWLMSWGEVIANFSGKEFRIPCKHLKVVLPYDDELEIISNKFTKASWILVLASRELKRDPAT